MWTCRSHVSHLLMLIALLVICIVVMVVVVVVHVLLVAEAMLHEVGMSPISDNVATIEHGSPAQGRWPF